MPLVRAEVRNENALGELYREVNKEDPKEILEGVSVAGLVGVLRQLGDLVEFAAEVFHGLQEEAMRTSSRSHKLMARVKQVETSLSPLEKALLAQRSHLHFAYTAGFNWHTSIQCEQNHFIHTNVPQFIMDSYDDCRVTPCLQLLDKFDASGPGSCLKRYSDPTIFSRGSVASGYAIGYKTSKDKKGRKIKKRSWTRSRDVSRDASFAYCSGRLLFTRTNVDGQSSSSQTASAYDATQRSNFNEKTTSTLRNEGYFHPTNSVLTEEREFKESISSPVKRRESDIIDNNILEGKNRDAYHDIQIYPSRNPAGFSSSSATWREKNTHNGDDEDDIDDHDDVRSMEDKTQNPENDAITSDNNHSRLLESFSPVLNQEFPGGKVDDIEIADIMDREPCNKVVRAPESTDSSLHDIESETDHFMDALNTIESACETDTDYPKKEQMKLYHKPEDTSVKEEVSEVVRHDVESQSWNFESNILAESSLINGGYDDNLNPLSPNSHHATKSNADEFNVSFLVDKGLQSSQMANGSLMPAIPKSINSHDSDKCNGGNTLESVLCTISSNIMDDLPEMSITNGTRMGLDSKKHVPETSTVVPVTFWTNGGLLGLQPSKPPDFSVLSSPDGDLAIKKEIKMGTSTQHITSGKAVSQTEISKHSEEIFSSDSCAVDEKQVSSPSVTKTLWKIPPADLDIKLGKSWDPNLCNSNPDIPTGSAVALSQMLELSSTWLSTGDNKKLLPGKNKKTSPMVHHNTNASEQKNRVAITNHTFCGQNKYLFSGKSSIMSPSSSPPLAHMKISFQPINGSETLKLKLKCPGGSNDNGGNNFPSFQLVPEVSMAHVNICSDSDADTFYRSSPSLLDDSHSNQWSESNSERWESSESPTGKDCDIYDALQRISVSTVLENGHEEFSFVENWSGNTGSGFSFDTRNLGTMTGSLGKELKNDISSLKDVLGPQQFVVMPAPPPLPPVHWQKSDASAEGLQCELGLMCLGNTVSQPKPVPFEDQFDTMHMWKSKSSKEMNLAKGMDEKDFLHQTTTKSFNLRPTVTTKPTVASANVQVNAIIQKANAIRQAVGSDGDDEGNWSDT